MPRREDLAPLPNDRHSFSPPGILTSLRSSGCMRPQGAKGSARRAGSCTGGGERRFLQGRGGAFYFRASVFAEQKRRRMLRILPLIPRKRSPYRRKTDDSCIAIRLARNRVFEESRHRKRHIMPFTRPFPPRGKALYFEILHSLRGFTEF